MAVFLPTFIARAIVVVLPQVKLPAIEGSQSEV